MTKLTVKNNNRSIPKNQTSRKKIGGSILNPLELAVTLIIQSYITPKINDILLNSNYRKIKNLESKFEKLESQFEKLKIELDKNKPLHLRIYDGIIKLLEKYPKLLTLLGAILTPALIYKLSKNMLGTKVTKVTSPPKSVVKLMKMYLNNAS